MHSESVPLTQGKPLAYSAAQLADRLNVSLRHVRRMDAAGKLPRPVRLGRSVRWPLREIEAWLSAGAPDRRTWEALRNRGRTGRCRAPGTNR